jgi:phosphatidylglycerophosphatase A
VNVKLFLAQGFGIGRIPVMPGTFGSLIGLLWFAALLSPRSPILFFAGILVSIPISVWLCAEAERILKQHDPGSVVMDEIIAIPLSFLSWTLIVYFTKKTWPSVDYFFSAPHWPMTVAVFVLFRIFDIAKPWPVRQSQKLHGGWGVTADDVLAAVYVNIVILVAWMLKPTWF